MSIWEENESQPLPDTTEIYIPFMPYTDLNAKDEATKVPEYNQENMLMRLG